MARFSFRFGPLLVREFSAGLGFSVNDVWRLRHPEASDVHVTLPLNGLVAPHVTAVIPRSKPQRYDLWPCPIDAAKLAAVLTSWQQELSVHWLRLLDPVDLDDLARRDYVAARFEWPKLLRYLAPFLDRYGNFSTRNPGAFMGVFWDILAESLVDTTDLRPEDGVRPLPMVMRIDDDGIHDAAWLSYLERPLPYLGASAGWHRLPIDALQPEFAMRSLLRLGGDPLLEALRCVAYHFGADLDEGPLR